MRKSQLNNFSLLDQDVLQIQSIIYQHEENPTIYENLTPEQQFRMMFVILSKSGYQRTQNEIHILKKATTQITFFKQLVEKTQGEYLWERCLRRMSHVHVPAGAYLFRQGILNIKAFFLNKGDKGTTFYIILQGRVQILKRLQVDKDQFQEREVNQLSTGESFGELALIDNSPRTASIRAIVATHLAVLQAEDYLVIDKTFVKIFFSIVKQNQQRSIYYEEFAKLSIFNDWRFISIKAMFDCVKFHKFGLNHSVYKEGDPSTDVYFIQSGEFKVIKQLKNNRTATEVNEKDDLEYLLDQFAQTSRKQSNQERIDELFQKKKYGSLFQTEKKHTITLKFLGVGEMFGELEILKQPDLVRQFSVISTQEQNRLYSIPKKDFLRVLQSDSKLSVTLRNLNDIKMKQILQQIKVFDKNFIDQSQKKQELEITQTKDYLYKMNEEAGQPGEYLLKTSKSSCFLKLSSRKKYIDFGQREVTLTLDIPDLDGTTSNHYRKKQHSRGVSNQIQTPTPQKRKQTMKSSSKKSNDTLFGIELGKINLNSYKRPFLNTTSTSPKSDLRKFQNTQIYFKTSLPLVLQNKYIRLKGKNL